MKYFTLEQQAILILLRKSLWGESGSLPEELNWETLDTMAKQQGVLALCYGGAVALKAQMPKELKQKWNQQTLMGVMKNQRLLAAQDQLLQKLREAEIPAAILKGSSVARCYPQPDLRVLGDIDVLVPRETLETAKVIVEQLGYRFHEADHEFHLGYSRPDAYVEVHYNVTTLPECRGAEATKAQIASFLQESVAAEQQGHPFTMLSSTHQALMLLLHMVRHMLESGIGLRQLCDWMMYLAHENPENFQADTVPVLEACGLLRYAKVSTAACIAYLGLPETCGTWCRDVSVKDALAFMENLFLGGNMGRADSEQIGRLLAKDSMLGEKKSFLKMSLASLSAYIQSQYPITQKHRWLVPFFWIFLPIRYWIRSLLGLRKKKSVTQAVKNAQKQRRFLEMLEIFQVDSE